MNMSSPLFSIIIPTFNAAPKLAATLDSVVSQGADCEVWVMDGASTDETARIIAPYLARENLSFYSERDAGVYDAMNRGIERARGRYLYFLGAGDALLPDALAAMAPHLPDDDGSFVYGDVRLSDGTIWGGRMGAQRLRKRNICHQAVFYGREVFERLGSYDLRYPILSDYAFNLRCFADADIAKIYADVTVATFEGGGLSASHYDEMFVADRLKLVRPLGPLPYALSALEARVPPSLKEWRYQTWARLRARLRR